MTTQKKLLQQEFVTESPHWLLRNRTIMILTKKIDQKATFIHPRQ